MNIFPRILTSPRRVKELVAENAILKADLIASQEQTKRMAKNHRQDLERERRKTDDILAKSTKIVIRNDGFRDGVYSVVVDISSDMMFQLGGKYKDRVADFICSRVEHEIRNSNFVQAPNP